MPTTVSEIPRERQLVSKESHKNYVLIILKKSQDFMYKHLMK